MEPDDRELKCPKCQSPMEHVTFRGVEVDRCTHCGGLWFDAFEKEELRPLKDAERIDTGDPEVGRQYNAMDRIDCPVCHTAMIRMVDLKQPHIWYESCTVCYGAFFDAGEFTDFKEDTLGDTLRSLFSRERR